MTPNLRCHHDMTGADVASSAKQPSPKQRWRESFADSGGEAFAAIVSADVELDSSALARPVHGERPPLALMALGGLGVALLALGAFGPQPIETPVTVAGSLCLAAAHFWNWRRHGRRHAAEGQATVAPCS